MFDKEEFGKRIRVIRLEKELSQEEFGEMLGVTLHTISKLEKGQRSPSVELLYTICKEFNVSSDDLLGLKDNDR